MIKDGVMYVTASYSRVYAIDVKTGEEIWQYDARLPDGIMPCCDVVNRGVALYNDKVIFGTLDAKLVALNKDTGKPMWIKKVADYQAGYRSEEHTSELQSRPHLVCRLLLEKKNKKIKK